MSEIPNAASGGAAPRSRAPRKFIQGIVTSAKMVKTIAVRTSTKVKHPVYGKYVTRYEVYKAHDEARTARLGDVVEIAFARRLSKTKNWTLVRVVTAARVVAVRGEEELASLPVRQVPVRTPAKAPAVAPADGPAVDGDGGVS